MFSHARMFSAAQLFSAFRTAGLPISSRLGGVPQGERDGGGRGGTLPPNFSTPMFVPCFPWACSPGVRVLHSCHDNTGTARTQVHVQAAEVAGCWAAGPVHGAAWFGGGYVANDVAHAEAVSKAWAGGEHWASGAVQADRPWGDGIAT